MASSRPGKRVRSAEVRTIEGGRSRPGVPHSRREYGYRPIEERVLKALPGWKAWPRSLRRIYTLLEAFGASEDGLREICEELGMDSQGVWKVIERYPDFKQALEDYRQTGQYAKLKAWRTPLRSSYLQLVYAQESSMLQFMHLENLKGQGGAGNSFATRVAQESGYLDNFEALGDRPEMRSVRDGEHDVPGQVVEDRRVRGGKTPEQWDAVREESVSGLPVFQDSERP